MPYAVRALIAASGAVFVAAGMYALGQALYGGEMADGYTPWDAVARDVVITSILVGMALATPHRRGLRLLWLLAGALWIWMLVEPPIDTADAGPPGAGAEGHSQARRAFGGRGQAVGLQAQVVEAQSLKDAQQAFCTKEGRFATETELVQKGYLPNESTTWDMAVFPGNQCGTRPVGCVRVHAGIRSQREAWSSVACMAVQCRGGGLDAAISAFTITPKRQETIDFKFVGISKAEARKVIGSTSRLDGGMVCGTTKPPPSRLPTARRCCAPSTAAATRSGRP